MLKNSEQIALNQYLNCYPENMSFKEIIEIIKNDLDHEEICIGEAYEEIYSPLLANDIQILSEVIEKRMSINELIINDNPKNIKKKLHQLPGCVLSEMRRLIDEVLEDQ